MYLVLLLVFSWCHVLSTATGAWHVCLDVNKITITAARSQPTSSSCVATFYHLAIVKNINQHCRSKAHVCCHFTLHFSTLCQSPLFTLYIMVECYVLPPQKGRLALSPQFNCLQPWDLMIQLDKSMKTDHNSNNNSKIVDHGRVQCPAFSKKRKTGCRQPLPQSWIFH